MKEIETLDVIKAGGLNYEDLLGRAVDRCLHYRAVDPDYKFHFSVCGQKQLYGYDTRSSPEFFD